MDTDFNKEKNIIELDILRKQLQKADLEIRKIENENNKIIQEKIKIKEETNKLRKEINELDTHWFLRQLTLETIGKIVLGAGVMAFTYSIVIQPYFSWREAILNERATSLKDTLSNKVSQLSILNNELYVKQKKLNTLEKEIVSNMNKLNDASYSNRLLEYRNNKLKSIGDTLNIINKRKELFSEIEERWFDSQEASFDVSTLKYFTLNDNWYFNQVGIKKDLTGYKEFVKIISIDYYNSVCKNLFIYILEVDKKVTRGYGREKEERKLYEEMIESQIFLIDNEFIRRVNVDKITQDKELWYAIRHNLQGFVKMKLIKYKNELKMYILKSNDKEIDRIKEELKINIFVR